LALKALLFFFLSTAVCFASPLGIRMVENHVWGSGETLLAFLQENMIPLKLYYEMDEEDEKLLADIRNNTIYQVLRDDKGKIEQVLLPLDDELALHIMRTDENGYEAKVVPLAYETKNKSIMITFQGIPSKEIMRKTENFELSLGVEQLFRGVVDFRKIRIGDKLIIYYTEKKRLGKFFGEQKIEAAMMEEGGKRYYQFLALDGHYYDQRGKSTAGASAFIVPCRYKRISSPFTKKRWHPILKRYRAHHGIDYALSSGTPVKAAYGGKVIFVGTKGGYGKTVVIRHPAGYRTLYAHLSAFKTSVGKRVKTGEIIAKSGNTGRSTGPHLHFGLSLNGRWIDPAMKIVFKRGLTGSKKLAFKASVKVYMNKMKALLQSQEGEIPNLEELEQRAGARAGKDAV